MWTPIGCSLRARPATDPTTATGNGRFRGSWCPAFGDLAEFAALDDVVDGVGIAGILDE